MYRGFPRDLVPRLACQDDGSELRADSQSDHGWIEQGRLVCVSCGRGYPIRDGIAVFDDGQALNPVARQELMARERDAGRLEGKIAARFHKEVAPTLAALGDLGGQTVIEYAAGTGCYTRHLQGRCDALLAVDFSPASLQVLAEGEVSPKVGLAQANAVNFRTMPGVFDLAFAGQFIEHLDTPAARKGYYTNVASTLRSGGRFVATVYHYDLRMRLEGREPTGFHRSGIYYRYFTRRELADELRGAFGEVSVRVIDVTLPLERRLRLSPSAGGLVSAVSSCIYPLNLLGHLLLSTAGKQQRSTRTAR